MTVTSQQSIFTSAADGQNWPDFNFDQCRAGQNWPGPVYSLPGPVYSLPGPVYSLPFIEKNWNL